MNTPSRPDRNAYEMIAAGPCYRGVSARDQSFVSGCTSAGDRIVADKSGRTSRESPADMVPIRGVLVVIAILMRFPNSWLCLAAGLVPLTCRAVGLSPEDSPRQPKFVILFADDLGYCGTELKGCDEIPTPNYPSHSREREDVHGRLRYSGHLQPFPRRVADGTLPTAIRIRIQHRPGADHVRGAGWPAIRQKDDGGHCRRHGVFDRNDRQAAPRE